MFSKTVEIVEIIEIVEIFGVPEPSIAPTGLRFQSPCGFSVRPYIFRIWNFSGNEKFCGRMFLHKNFFVVVLVEISAKGFHG